MTEQFIHHHDHDGIPFFSFDSIKRAAIDQYYEVAIPVLEAHITEHQDRIPFCYALDLSASGMFPVKYMMERAQIALEALPYRPQHYIAYVMADPRDTMLVNILEQLTANNLEHTRKVFVPDQIPEAVKWLKRIKEAFIAGNA